MSIYINMDRELGIETYGAAYYIDTDITYHIHFTSSLTCKTFKNKNRF